MRLVRDNKETMMLRRTVLGTLGCLFAVTRPQAAEVFPDKPIRIVAASGAGGSADVVSRILADKLTHELGQPVIVEPKAGANGNIAAEYVAKAPPDGYTLMMGTIGVLAINPLSTRTSATTR